MLADFPDGTWSTFLVVEAGPPVPWTKPEDLPYEPDPPLLRLDTLFKDGFRAGMGAGSMHWVPQGTRNADFRAAITRNGRESLSPAW